MIDVTIWVLFVMVTNHVGVQEFVGKAACVNAAREVKAVRSWAITVCVPKSEVKT